MKTLISFLFFCLLIGASISFAEANTLTWGRGGDSVSLDPALAQDGESLKVIMHIFDTLVRFKSGSLQIEPSLATSWEASPDGKIWTFKLRDNVLFHDNTPLNADAVVFSFMRQLSPTHPNYINGVWAQSNFTNLLSVSALDKLTVQFTLKQAYAPFLANLAMIAAAPIVSPTAARHHGKNFSHHPVGTGPFRFKDWTPGEHIILQRNTAYWDTPPVINTLVFKTIMNNHNRLNALKANAIQGMDGVDNTGLKTISRDPQLQILNGISMNVGYLAINNERPPFNNILVRKAINHAISKDRLVKLYYQGRAIPAKGPLPPGMLGYSTTQPEYDFNPKLARELLKKAGYSKIEATLWTPPIPRPAIPEPMKIAMTIQSSLSAIGINMRIISPPSWREYLDKVNRGEHDTCLLSWMGDNGDPDNFLYTLLDQDNAIKPKALNRAFFRDQDVHSLLIRAQTTIDLPTRDTLYQRAMLLIHDKAPWVPLAHTQTLIATRVHLEGCNVTAYNLPNLTRAHFK